jgi:hypothetical protein
MPWSSKHPLFSMFFHQTRSAFLFTSMHANLSIPSGYFTYYCFNIHQFHVLPAVYLCVLCGSQNKQRLFPYTPLTDWFL